MKALVLDLETTVQKVGEKEVIDGSPYNPDNYCVSAHWRRVDNFIIGEAERAIWNHNDYDGCDPTAPLQEALDWADVVVAHNGKFDFEWLIEMGFTLPEEKVYCTMIGEYILARGRAKILGLSLAATAGKSRGLAPVFDLMNDMLLVLMDMEQNGIYIDKDELHRIGDEYVQEQEDIKKRLQEIAEMVMGDTKINLASGDDLTAVVYSRAVVDKKKHKEVFNIGLDERGNKKYPPRMKKPKFREAVRQTTKVVHKTVIHCCPDCNGSGYYYRKKKDGTNYKKPNKCKTCLGEGVLYVPTGEVAGLKLSPEEASWAAAGGFSVNKDTIKKLIYQAEQKKNDLAVEFLTKFTRLNAVSSYINNFIYGIDTWLRPNGLLHTNFNQTVTDTGRLSSTKPNFQNLPKAKRFPVRRAVRSRWKGGCIVEADYSGLEFVVAGELSRDEQIIKDIHDKKDVHRQTASIVLQKAKEEVLKDERDENKPHTFKPLYGGKGFNEPPHIRKYFNDFFVIYSGLKKYHNALFDGVMTDGIVRIPSGREYYFPNCKRYPSGSISNGTKVVNYPVQGFATGDIVPLACIRARRLFKQAGVQSLLMITVHDSIVVDCYPGELEIVCQLLEQAMTGVIEEMKVRFNYEFILPLRIEIEAGDTWNELKPTEYSEGTLQPELMPQLSTFEVDLEAAFGLE